jgi:hypothetical protein
MRRRWRRAHINNIALGRYGRHRTNVWDYVSQNALNGTVKSKLASLRAIFWCHVFGVRPRPWPHSAGAAAAAPAPASNSLAPHDEEQRSFDHTRAASMRLLELEPQLDLDCSNRGGLILDPFGGAGTTLIAVSSRKWLPAFA